MTQTPAPKPHHKRKRLPFDYRPTIATRHARFHKLPPLTKDELRSLGTQPLQVRRIAPRKRSRYDTPA